MLSGRAPDKRRIRFHCRFQGEVYDCYQKHSRGISKAIRHALLRFRQAVGGGMLRLDSRSRFLGRPLREDKIELHVQLTVADKDLLEKLSFALRASQAEVLRMALEWYMEATRMQSPQSVFYAARRKWHHRRPSLKPVSMWFSFWEPNRLLGWQFPLQDDITAACAATRDPSPNRFYMN